MQPVFFWQLLALLVGVDRASICRAMFVVLWQAVLQQPTHHISILLVGLIVMLCFCSSVITGGGISDRAMIEVVRTSCTGSLLRQGSQKLYPVVSFSSSCFGPPIFSTTIVPPRFERLGTQKH